MSELIVLTCASGKQCNHLIPLISQQSTKYRLRLVVHSVTSLRRLQKLYPQAEVLQANLDNQADCTKILDGATAIYYVGPTFQPREVYYAINVIDAAVAEAARPKSNFVHFILSSVLHPEVSKLLNHDRKRIIEEYLLESTLPFTILQPSHFVDNTLGRLLDLKDSPNPKFKASHDPNVAFSFSCLKDHAEVSMKILQERSKHYYATYQLVSTLPIKYTDYIRSVGDEMGKSIQIETMPFEQVVQLYCNMLFGPDGAKDQNFRDGPERLLLYYNVRGLSGNPAVLEWLLGRPATTPAQLARQMLNASCQNGE